MHDDHLSVETWALWLSGRLEHEKHLKEVVPHFLPRCETCRARYEELRRLQAEVGHWDEMVAVVEGPEAPDLLAALEGLPYEEQLRKVEEEETWHGWAFCQHLLKKSLDAAFEEPEAAVNLAELAVQVSAHLGEAYDRNWVLDLRARAFGYLGNARRVLGELRSAEAAFRQAEKFLARSTTGNTRVAAEILDMKGSLRRAQRRLREALQLVDRALELYQENDDLHGTALAFLKKGKFLEEAGDLDQAIVLLSQSQFVLNPSGDPRLHAYARYNLLGCLALAGRHAEAEQLLPEVRDLLRATGQPLDLVRLRWAEGNVELGLGRFGPAEAALREVQQEFLERRMGYDAALVSLDLAVLYAEQKETAALKRLAAEIVPVFESREVHREAMAALLMFQHACEEETLTAGLARHLATLLQRERRGPGGR